MASITLSALKRVARPSLFDLRSSRSARSATLERYTLIRNFFCNQPSLPVTTLRHCYTTSFVRPKSCTPLNLNSSRICLALSRSLSTQPTPPKPPDKQKDTHDAHTTTSSTHHYLDDYSKFFRRLALSVPHPHRPTREDLLGVATGFWQRIRIRFKWFTIKSFRKFNADDISAFVTWFLMSQTLWILVGTSVNHHSLFISVNQFCDSTTFFSVIFAILNSLRLQSRLIVEFANSCRLTFCTARLRCSRYQRLSHIGDRNHHHFRICHRSEMERLSDFF